MTYILVSPPAHADIFTFNSISGSFTYRPNLNYNGNDSFQYSVSDGTANSTAKSVNINIVPINDAPVAVDGNFSTNEDVNLQADAQASDIEIGRASCRERV